MPRLAVVLPVVAVLAGVICVATLNSLLGPLLIIGGVGALGVLAIPAAVAVVARWLSAGR